MRLSITKVKTKQQRNTLCKLEKEINLLFLSYAKQIGIEDYDLEKRCTEEYGLRYFESPQYQNYLIYDKEDLIGFFVFQISLSEYTQKIILIPS